MISSALTTFERFWNSSFGIPQQLIFRALRVAQGDASFFSERGFLDASLIPVFGGFDSRRGDVDSKEMVERINRLTPDALDMDEDHFGAQLATSILTDPLSFLTSGLTAGGKAAGALVKGLRYAGKSEAELLKLGKKGLATELDNILKAPTAKLKGKARRRIRGARKALDKIEGDDLPGALADINKREQLIALPILGAAFGPKARVSDQYKSWFQLLRDKSGANTAAAYLTSGVGQGIPALRHITGAIAGTAAGIRYAGHAARALKVNALAAEGELPELADFLNGTSKLAQKLGEARTARPTADKLIKAAQEGNARAFVRQVLGRDRLKGIRNDEEAVSRALDEALEMIGVDSLDDVTPGTLEEFLRRHEKAAARLDEVSSEFDFTAEFEGAEKVRGLNKGADIGFKVGRKLEMARRKWFVSDAPGSKEFDLAAKEVRGLNARNTQRIAAMGEAAVELLRRDAKKFGWEVEDFEALHLSILQMDTLEQELLSLVDDPFSTASRVESFALRMDSAVDQLVSRLQPLSGKTSEEVKELAEHLVESRGFGLFDGLQFEGQFKGPSKVVRIDPAKPPGGVKHNRHILSEGPYEGRYLGHLTDRQLNKVRSRLASKGTRKRTDEEVAQQLLIRDSTASALKALKISAKDAVRAARRKGPVKRIRRADGKYVSIDGEQGKALQKLLARVTRETQTDIFDRRLLSGADLKDYEEASALYELRKADVKPEPRIAASGKRTVEHADARELEGLTGQVEIDGELMPVELSPMMEGIGRIMLLRKELQRVATRTGNPSPALLGDLATETARLSAQMVDPIKEALTEAGAGETFKFLDGIRKEVLAEATRNGVLGPDSPLAYLGRIYAKDELKALDDILGKTEVQGAIDASLPKMASMFQRSADAMSLEELNMVHQAVVDAGHTKTAELLKARMEAMGLKPGRYEESPLLSLLTRLSQSQQRDTAAGVVKHMLDEGAKSGSVVGGKVVRVVRGAGTRRSGQVKRVAGKKGVQRKSDEAVQVVESDVDSAVTAVIVEDHTGRQIAIPADEFGLRVSGIRLGKLDYGDEGGAAVNKAFARKSGQGGRIPDTDQFGMSGPLGHSELANLEGEYVLMGEHSTWKGMFDAFAKQWDDGPAALVAMDTGISLMKQMQTTFRPVFHMMNTAGAYPMALTAGATPKSLLLGTASAARFLSSAQDNVRWYERYTALVGEGRVGFRAKVTGGATTAAVRRGGTAGFRTTEEAAQAAGVTAEDLLFHTADGGVEDLGAMLDALDRHNVFTGFVAEGLRGTSTTPERLRVLREHMVNPDAAKAKLGKAYGKLRDTLEGSENYARLMTFFSLRHAGQSLDEAARNTVLAMVPYHDLTHFERVAMKRIFTYYSFPRHYTGQAYRYFAERPDIAARYAHTITSEGGVVERDGRLVVDTAAGQLNVGRLDPNLEALGTLKAWGEVFTETAAALGNDSAAAAVRERDALGRRAPFPIEPGAPAMVAANLAQFKVGDAITEAGEAFWITRFFMDEGDPLKETSGLQKLNESVLNPFKEARPEHTRRVIVARYQQLKRTLQRKLMVHNNDPELVALYTDELRRVERALTAQLEGK